MLLFEGDCMLLFGCTALLRFWRYALMQAFVRGDPTPAKFGWPKLCATTWSDLQTYLYAEM